MTTRTAFDRELQRLRDNLLRLGSMVDTAIHQAVQALRGRDRAQAQRVIVGDQNINDLRFEIEKDCLALIACQQPAARDLRFIVAALNIALDLERMADHATGIAAVVYRAAESLPPEFPPDLSHMVEITRAMLHASLDALVRDQAQEALAVTERDEQVDLLYNQLFRQLIFRMAQDPRAVPWGMYLLFCAHNVERIADRVTNICERVVFVATGRMEEIPSELRVSQHPWPQATNLEAAAY